MINAPKLSLVFRSRGLLWMQTEGKNRGGGWGGGLGDKATLTYNRLCPFFFTNTITSQNVRPRCCSKSPTAAVMFGQHLVSCTRMARKQRLFSQAGKIVTCRDVSISSWDDERRYWPETCSAMLVTSRSAIYLGRWGSLIVHAHKLSCVIRGKQIAYDKPSTLNSWATWIATDCCVKCMNNRFLKCKVTHWAGCIVALSAVLGQHAKVCLSVLHSHYCTTTIWTRLAIWLHPVHEIASPHLLVT